jgi:hypothetical protein
MVTPVIVDEPIGAKLQMGTHIRFSDGNPHRIPPGWDPQGFGTPLFFMPRPFDEGNVIGHA